ncbi:D-alanyl-D-alanine carboxypeptidase family protein [Paucibacter sp. R3-3]|uniref:serine-type D-Ala-D-Ala carboxypeptidase n=1 Tax=Roseateles agri TaxID=3098619 RepID=A0ABU5DT33_9BURK|nr:D-alanyl-D-alanine carboxypeptidase family protein [Paucibacter sp. R3-3]MDY0748544.1 D-alanyl-D-alanine carboxypeptidase family protein [Paucibacter sp. R3-3]
MKKQLIALVVVATAALNVSAQAPQPPELAARNYILLDVTANKVLAERDADAPQDPASLTKLMTAYVVFDALKQKRLTLEQTLPVSRRAWEESRGGRSGESVMFIDMTMTPTVDQLLRGLIVQSGGDAAVALAEGVGGSVEQFVEMMNRQSQAWGLKNTHFTNVTGITDASHKSSARDVAVIATHIIQDFPQYYPYYSQKDFTFNKIKQGNRNVLLTRDPSVDGMKTGYTEAAGYCLVASAQRDFPNGKRRLLSVVMGTASKEARASESQKLLNWGYTAFDAVRLFEGDKAVSTVPVWKGAEKTAKLGPAGPVYVAVPRGEGGKLQTQMEHTDPLVAPLTKGQRVGTLKVTTASGAPVAEVPLVVQEPVELAGLFGRAWDALRLWIK